MILTFFSDFSQDDQLILIKLGFFEVWLSHVTKIATEADALLTFDDGSYLTKEQLEILYDVSDSRSDNKSYIVMGYLFLF